MIVLTKESKIFSFINVIIGLFGVALSSYTIWHHRELKSQGVTDASCNINQTISCDAVAASQYSEFFGYPLGVYGFGYFLATFLLGMIILSSESKRESNLMALAVLGFVGACVSLVLGGIAVFAVGAFCLSCAFIYLLTFILAGSSVMFLRASQVSPSLKESSSGLTTASIFVVLTILVYSQLFTGIDPRDHPNFVQEIIKNTENQPPLLSSKTVDIPLNLSPYSGLGEDFRKGSDRARVTIVEFADFECPACSHAGMVLQEVAKQYGERVNIVFKNYPLDNTCNKNVGPFHKNACKIAILARCAGQFGKFWDYHDLAFQSSGKASTGDPEKWAKQIGLNDNDVKQCLTNKTIVEKVKDDIKIGQDVGIQGTPTIFINGKKYLGDVNPFMISSAIDGILNQ